MEKEWDQYKEIFKSIVKDIIQSKPNYPVDDLADYPTDDLVRFSLNCVDSPEMMKPLISFIQLPDEQESEEE